MPQSHLQGDIQGNQRLQHGVMHLAGDALPFLSGGQIYQALVELGVVDGLRDMAAEDLQQADLLRRDRLRRVVDVDQRADHFVAHAQRRADQRLHAGHAQHPAHRANGHLPVFPVDQHRLQELRGNLHRLVGARGFPGGRPRPQVIIDFLEDDRQVGVGQQARQVHRRLVRRDRIQGGAQRDRAVIEHVQLGHPLGDLTLLPQQLLGTGTGIRLDDGLDPGIQGLQNPQPGLGGVGQQGRTQSGAQRQEEPRKVDQGQPVRRDAGRK